MVARQQQGRQEEALWLVSKPDLDDKSGTEGWLFKLKATGIVLTPPENADFKECSQYKRSQYQVTAYEKGSKELWRGKKTLRRVRQAFRNGGAAWISYSLRVKLQKSVTFRRGFLDPGLLGQPALSRRHWQWRAGHFTKQVIYLKCTVTVRALNRLY